MKVAPRGDGVLGRLQGGLLGLAELLLAWGCLGAMLSGSVAAQSQPSAVERAAEPARVATVLGGEEMGEVLRSLEIPSPERMVYAALQKQAHVALAKRTERYEAIKTVADAQAYQARLRELFERQLGGFPQRTPLNARVVGQLQGEGYRIEKVVYESRPQHHVTAVLYLPEAKPPFPAVLIACGHTKSGKAAEYNQRIGILLAKHGLAALCYDPIGQGERSQMLGEDGKPVYSGSTSEHFLVGIGSILVGRNTANYRIYDGLRGIDYLVSRPDIDGQRIGCTGCSGGGTLTSYIMALDERVQCAAPACYLTTFRSLIDSIGPQDAEQNVFAQLALQIDHPDYVLMRAPRPTLICSTTDDYFDIHGAWDTFRQAKRFYTRLGYPERVDLVEVEGGHGVRRPSREALTQWMSRWLLGRDVSIRETDFKVWGEADLRCLPEGEVLKLPGERSVFDLNAEAAEELAAARQPLDDAELRQTVRRVARIRPLEKLPPWKLARRVQAEHEGLRVDQLLLHTDQGIALPGLLFVPAASAGQAASEAYLLVDGDGKQNQLGEAHRLARAGHLVLAVDLRGTGETSPGPANAVIGAEWKEYYLAYLLGQSLVGLRAEDTLQAARFLAAVDKPTSPRRIHIQASGAAAVPALHAAALEPQLVGSLQLTGAPASWRELAGQPNPRGRLSEAVHRALASYDLTDLRRLVSQLKAEQ